MAKMVEAQQLRRNWRFDVYFYIIGFALSAVLMRYVLIQFDLELTLGKPQGKFDIARSYYISFDAG